MKQRFLLKIQGSYYGATGIWPVVHMPSFEAVTGPKVEDWLVRMVGLLAAVIGSTLYIAGQRDTRSIDIIWLAISSAGAFTAIDVFYSLRGTISLIYLADALVQVTIIAFLLRQRDTD